MYNTTPSTGLLRLLGIYLPQVSSHKIIKTSKGCRHTFIVLSAPPVISRVPVWSNVEQKTPASASRDPG